MLDPVVLATVLAVVFVGELPDKTAVACLVLGARYRPLPVLGGVCAAFAVHVCVAVVAGSLLGVLPHRPVDAVTGVLFLVGAVLLLRSDPSQALASGERNAAGVGGVRSDRRVLAGAFGVVLVAEFGDLTQVLTATLAARYDNPVSVGIGALLALCAVAALAVGLGNRLLQLVPLRRVQQVAAVVLVALAVHALGKALLPHA